MEKKEVTVEIVSFIIIILGIVGYFTYDLFFNKKKTMKTFDFTVTTLTMNLNEKQGLNSYIVSDDLNISDLTFITSNSDIAYVKDGELVSLKKNGQVTLTVSYKDFSKELPIKVGNAILKFNNDVLKLEENSTINLYDYLTIKGIDKSDVTFNCANDLINIENNIVTINKLGTYSILAKANGLEASLKLEVSENCNYSFDDISQSLKNKIELKCDKTIVKISNEIEAIFDKKEDNQYELNMTIKNKKIESQLIKKDIMSIYHIFKFDKIYIFMTNNGNQCLSNSTLVFNEDGILLNSFENKEFTYNEDNTLDVLSMDGCMPDCGNEENKTYSEKIKYKYNGTILEEIEKEVKTYKDVCVH